MPMNPYIKINKLNMEYLPSSSISLSVKKGEIIGITGKNGCGKSTLAKYLTGNLRPERIGSVQIAGYDPFSLLDREKIHRFTDYVCQNPRDSIVYENVVDDIIFGLENKGLDKEKIAKRLKYYMNLFDLKKIKRKRYSDLTGSELERAMLVSSVIMQDEFIVLDEAFSRQEGSFSEKYLARLIKLVKKKNQTLIVFSKNQKLLALLEKVYVIDKGSLSLVAEKEYDEYSGIIDKLADFPKKGSSSGKKPESHNKLHIEELGTFFKKESDFKIRLHDISFNDIEIDYEFDAGHAYAIVGGASTGKTSLLNMLNGRNRKFTGTIEVDADARSSLVSEYSEQNILENTVLDDVMFGPYSYGHTKKESRKMAMETLRFVGVDESLWSRSPINLSEGERRLVSLAGAIALNPDFILLDEPFVSLDDDYKEKVNQILVGLCRNGKCVIVTETA